MSIAPASTARQMVDALAVCRGYIGDAGPTSLIMRIPGAINSIEGQLTSTQVVEMMAISAKLEQLIAMPPSNMATHLRTPQLPFRQVADAVNTGGALTLNTGGVRDTALPLLLACGEAGYQANR
jgi:hypothetical protein